MKKKYITMIVLILLCIPSIFLGLIYLKLRSDSLFIKEIKNRMQQADIYIPVAETLAQYCQAVDRELPLYGCSYFPANIRQLRPVYGDISPSNAYLQMLGGFEHCSYCLKREDDLSWTLYYSDDAGEKKLYNFFLNNKPASITMETITKRIEEYFRNNISKYPKDFSLHESRLLFFLNMEKFDNALLACEDSIRHLPNCAWLHLMKSLLLSKDNKEKAIKAFGTWVDANPSYISYFYMFYLAKEMGETKLACDFIQKAIKQSLSTTDQYNVYYYAFQMTKYSHEEGEKETAIMVCDAMIDPSRKKERGMPSDSYVDFGKLKEAIQNNQQDIIHKCSTGIEEYNPYKSHSARWQFGMIDN